MQKSFFTSPKGQLISLLILTCITFINTLNNGFVLDDISVLSQNETVRKGIYGITEAFSSSYLFGYTGINEASYRPLPIAINSLIFEFAGLSSFSFHLLHLLFYLALGVVVWLYLKLILKNYHALLALGIVCFFMIHPLHSEVVANVKSLDELLASLFGFSGLLFSLKYSNKGGLKWLALGVFSLFLSLISKEIGLVFWILIPIQLWFFSSFSIKKVSVQSGLFLLPIIAFVTLRFLVLDNQLFADQESKLGVLNNGLMAAQTSSEFYGTTFSVLGYYFKLIFLPNPLSYDYSYQVFKIVDILNPKALISALIYLGLIVLSITGLIKKQVWAFGLIFFLATLSIYSNLPFQFASTAGERFLFTPLFGFVLFLFTGIAHFTKKSKAKRFKPSLYITICLLILGVFSVLSIQRNSAWKSNETLFLTDVETVPNSWRANLFAAKMLEKKAGKSSSNSSLNLLKKSNQFLLKSFEIYNGDTNIYLRLANNYILMNEGIKALKVLEAANKKFGHKESIQLIYGNTLMNLGKNEKAINTYKTLVNSKSQVTKNLSIYNLGAINLNTSNFKEAVNWFTLFLENKPNNDNGEYYLAMSYYGMNELDSSTEHFSKVSQDHPEYLHAQYSVGTIYLLQKKYNQAIKTFNNLLLYDDKNEEILNNLATAYVGIGEDKKAEEIINQLNQQPNAAGLGY